MHDVDVHSHYAFRMRVRAGLVTAIYAKALVLSNDERTRASGDIVNLMSVDATRLQDLCTYGLIAISGPLQVYSSTSRFRMQLLTNLYADYASIHLVVPPSWVGCLRRSCHHGVLCAVEHGSVVLFQKQNVKCNLHAHRHCTHFEAYAREADEE